MSQIWFLKRYDFFVFWVKKNLKNKNRAKVTFLLKLLLGFCILFFLFRTLQNKSNLTGQWDLWLQNLQKKSDSAQYWSVWGLVFLGVGLNWYAEAKKWQLLCAPFLSLSLSKALKSVWVGLAVSVVLPFGNLVGRLWITPLHQLKDRPLALPYTLLSLNALTQNALTYLFGLPAFCFLMQEKLAPLFNTFFSAPAFSFSNLWAFSVGPLLVFLTLFFYLFRRKALKKVSLFYRKHIALHSWKTIFELLGLSFFRYAVFTTQLVLLLFLFESELSTADYVLGVMATYFLKSLFPFFNLFFDLGLREGAALFIFEGLGADLLPILLASLSVWFLNLFLPTVFGLWWGREQFFNWKEIKNSFYQETK
jgi:hypothetical protein